MPSFDSGAVRRGLQPFKLDLHVHTPASHDWNGGEVTAADVVEAAVAAGLDGIAVTDHSNPTWIDQVKEAANGSALTVFPGVEVIAGIRVPLSSVSTLSPNGGRSLGIDVPSMGQREGMAAKFGNDSLCLR